MGVGDGGSKRLLEADENLMSEATTVLMQHMEWSHSESTFFFRTIQMKTMPLVLTIKAAHVHGVSCLVDHCLPAPVTALRHSGNKNIRCVNEEGRRVEGNRMNSPSG